jgi:hypothetical protein
VSGPAGTQYGQGGDGASTDGNFSGAGFQGIIIIRYPA